MRKKKKEISEKQLKANRLNAQKCTGPKTTEGKAIASMNGVKTGEYISDFYKIDGRFAGKLKICDQCSDEQKIICQSNAICMLHAELTYAYVMTRKEQNTKYIEEINMRQLATMDFLFTRQLRYAQMNLGEEEKYIDSEGRSRKRPKISNEFIRNLLDMAEKLSKTLPDMQLTKRTQEIIDISWAELAKAEINPEHAAEMRQKIISEMDTWRKSQITAKEMEKQDQAIKEFKKTESDSSDNFDVNDMSDPGNNPFGE